MQIAYRFRSVGTPPPLRLFTGWCGYLHVFNLQLSKKIKEMNIRHALMENSLFFCDCCVSLFWRMFITACVRETDSTDAQQKLFVCLLSSEQRKYSPLFLPLPLCPSLWCRFGFALMKKTETHEWTLFWAEAFAGRRGGEKVGKLARIWHLCLLNHKKRIFLKKIERGT